MFSPIPQGSGGEMLLKLYSLNHWKPLLNATDASFNVKGIGLYELVPPSPGFTHSAILRSKPQYSSHLKTYLSFYIQEGVRLHHEDRLTALRQQHEGVDSKAYLSYDSYDGGTLQAGLRISQPIHPSFEFIELSLNEEMAKQTEQMQVRLRLQGKPHKWLTGYFYFKDDAEIDLVVDKTNGDPRYTLTSVGHDGRKLEYRIDEKDLSVIGIPLPDITFPNHSIKVTQNGLDLHIDADQFDETFTNRVAQNEFAFPITASYKGEDLLRTEEEPTSLTS